VNQKIVKLLRKNARILGKTPSEYRALKEWHDNLPSPKKAFAQRNLKAVNKKLAEDIAKKKAETAA
jgi:hypothetical protein